MPTTPPSNPKFEPFTADGGPVGVVLSHGFTGTPASMRPWAEHLAAAGFTVRLPRLPGHGTTWQDANTTRWPDWYGAVEQAYDEVAARCSTVFAGGLSMGGTLVTRLAEEKVDKIAGLVLVNPAYTIQRFDAKLAPYIAWAVRSRPAIGGDIKKPGADESAYDRTPVVAFASLLKLWKITSADLAKVTAPIRLYRSVDDHVVDPSSAALLKARATSTTVEEILLHESYHVATIDNDAPTIFEGSVDFIRSLTVPSGGPHSVTTDATPTPDLPDPARRDNGLLSDSYVPLTDVGAELGPVLLTALGRARIAAYLVDTPAPSTAEIDASASETQRLYVASEERADARTIVAAVIKSVGGDPGPPPPPAPPAVTGDPLAGIDADAAFAELISDWHVDTHIAIKEAEKALSREDEDWRARLRQSPPPSEPIWLDDEHYVPPVPPPLPRFAAPTIMAMTVLVISILLLGLGGQFGLANQLTLLLGVCGVLLAVAMLIMRLRADTDEDDDGAIL